MYSKIIDFLPEALIEFEYDDILPQNTDGKKSTIQDLKDRLLQVETKNINPAALKLLGASSSIDLRENRHKLINDGLCSKFRLLLKKLGRGKTRVDLNLTIDNLKQQKKQLHASCAVIEGRHQDCSIVVFLKDLTSQKQIEYKLKSSLDDLKNNYRGIIDTFSHMVQIKDPYTAGHQKKVARLCRAIAGEMNLDKKTVEGLSYAAALHDIGKINIPASILAKPGKLTDIEYRMISTHSQLGYNMLKKINYPWPIEKIVLQHHERVDGSGYPRNLAGDEIMTEARILAIADVVEAMSSHRPYRPALGIDKALREIENNQDRLYDTAAAKACISLFKQKNYRF